MVGDLEAQELVNRRQSLRALRLDADARAAVGLLVCVSYLRPQALHDGDAGRHAVVYEHRRAEISFGEEARDVREVLPDGVAVIGVIGVVDFDLYEAAFAREDEMMRRCGLRE